VRLREDYALLDVYTDATRFPPYVFSATRGLLLHRVQRLRLYWYWWDEHGRGLGAPIRLACPRMFAECVCGQSFHLQGRTHAQLCQQPNPDALLCGRCQGQGPLFGKDRRARAGRRAMRKAMRAAHKKLVETP
jgi:hypothetical protein